MRLKRERERGSALLVSILVITLTGVVWVFVNRILKDLTHRAEIYRNLPPRSIWDAVGPNECAMTALFADYSTCTGPGTPVELRDAQMRVVVPPSGKVIDGKLTRLVCVNPIEFEVQVSQPTGWTKSRDLDCGRFFR